MRELRVIAVLLTLGLALCSCGDKEDNSNKTDNAPKLTSEDFGYMDGRRYISEKAEFIFTPPDDWEYFNYDDYGIDMSDMDDYALGFYCIQNLNEPVETVKVGYFKEDMSEFIDSYYSDETMIDFDKATMAITPIETDGSVEIAGKEYVKARFFVAYTDYPQYDQTNFLFVRHIDEDYFVCISATTKNDDGQGDITAMFAPLD